MKTPDTVGCKHGHGRELGHGHQDFLHMKHVASMHFMARCITLYSKASVYNMSQNENLVVTLAFPAQQLAVGKKVSPL